MEKYSPGLNYDKVKEIFPKTLKAIQDWFHGRSDIQMILSDQALGRDHDEIILGYTRVMVAFDTRKLYEFFDEQKIRIYITDHPEFDDLFFYYNSKSRNSKSAPSRIEAEESAFLDAFNLMETTL